MSGRGTRRRRLALWGALAAAVYLAAAVLSFSSGLVGGRPLYDGLPKQPYRWVTPPKERVANNRAPMAGGDTLRLNADGQADPYSVSTGDVQANVIFETVDVKGAPSTPVDMKVTITPLDPTGVGPRPPGRYFDSNAYRIEATYPSGAPIGSGKFDVVLTYAVHSTDIRRWDGTAWTRLQRPQAERSNLQIYSFTRALGIFVATGEGDVPREPEAASGPARPAVVYVVLGLGAAIGVAIAIFSGRRRQPAPAKKRPAKDQRVRTR